MRSIPCHAILQPVSVHKSRGFMYIHLEWMQHEERLLRAYISSSNIFSWSLRCLTHSRFSPFFKKNEFLPLYLWLLSNNSLYNLTTVWFWIWKQDYKAKSFKCWVINPAAVPMRHHFEDLTVPKVQSMLSMNETFWKYLDDNCLGSYMWNILSSQWWKSVKASVKNNPTQKLLKSLLDQRTSALQGLPPHSSQHVKPDTFTLQTFSLEIMPAHPPNLHTMKRLWVQLLPTPAKTLSKEWCTASQLAF